MVIVNTIEIMPKVSHFTQYGTVTPDDRIPFLHSTGGGQFDEGLVPPTGLSPNYSFKANVRAPFTNAFWLQQDASVVLADYDPAYLPDYWNTGFNLSNQRITPPVSGLYLFAFEGYANCGAGGGSFAVGDEALVSALWSNGLAALMVRQTYTADGDYTVTGSFMLRFDTTTAGQFVDRSYIRISGQLNAPSVQQPALILSISCSLIKLL